MIYDYRCSSCDHVFELELKLVERKIPITEPCPHCFKENCIEQVIGVANIGDSIRLGITKIDSRLKEKFQNLKRHYKGSTIKDY